METNNSIGNNIYRKSKRNMLIVLAITFFLGGVLESLAEVAVMPGRIINVIFTILYSVLLFGWCYYDALERNQPLSRGFRVVLIMFGVIGLFVYLFKSRGLIQGLRASGLALLGIVGILLLTVSGVLLTSLIIRIV